MIDQLSGQAVNPVVFGGNHQTRVKVKALSDTRTDRRKARDLSARPVIDFGRVCDDQEALPCCLLGKLPMVTRDRLKGDILTIKESVCGPQIIPGFGLLRETPRRICGDLRCQENESFGTAFVMKIGGGELGHGPSLGIRDKGVHPVLLRSEREPSPPLQRVAWLDITRYEARKAREKARVAHY